MNTRTQVAGQRHEDYRPSPWAVENPVTAFYAPALANDPSETEAKVSWPLSSLQRTIEAEVIPRLMLLHRTSGGVYKAPPAGMPGPISDEDVVAFVARVREADLASLASDIRAFIARGAGLREVYLDLLAPAARLLGEMWMDDRCSFAEVSLGTARLQQVMRLFAPVTPDFDDPLAEHSIFLAAFPGDRHVFGVAMLEEFFRDAGWRVISGRYDLPEELVEAAIASKARFVGISLSREELLDDLAATIQLIRSGRAGRAFHIMVGGPVFLRDPAQFMTVGADATAMDGPAAIEEARLLLRDTLNHSMRSRF